MIKSGQASNPVCVECFAKLFKPGDEIMDPTPGQKAEIFREILNEDT
jgi:hypothetical protein